MISDRAAARAACWLACLFVSSWLLAQHVRADDRPANYMPVTGSTLPPEPGPTRDRALTSGLGIGTGMGSDQVLFGGHLVYYVQFPNPRLRLAFHVGAGVNAGSDTKGQWGIRGGSSFLYGKRSRLVLGLVGGTMDWTSFGLHGHTSDTQQLYGGSFEAGYELMTEIGFYLRTTVGPGFAVIPKSPFYDRSVELIWTGNLLSLGFKLW